MCLDSQAHELGSSPRLLLVEDSPVTREVVQLMLATLKRQADVAEDGIRAIEACRLRQYEVVLMDVLMPRLDGHEATRQIRASTGSPFLPWIVGMSANTGTLDREECAAAGMNDFLEKPVRFERLEHVLRRASRRVRQVAKDRVQSGTASPQPGQEQRSPEAPSQDTIACLGHWDQEKLRCICDAYVKDAREVLSQLSLSAAENDYAAVRKKAHYLQGSSAMVGAVKLSSLCRELEDRSLAHEPAGRLLLEMEQVFQKTSTTLERLAEEYGRSMRNVD